jgi:hypothetical protein
MTERRKVRRTVPARLIALDDCEGEARVGNVADDRSVELHDALGLVEQLAAPSLQHSARFDSDLAERYDAPISGASSPSVPSIENDAEST